ncbi:MAG: hypothetical protein ACRCZB_05530 [Bacteroidales bacterium]
MKTTDREQIIIGALKACSSTESVEQVFSIFDIPKENYKYKTILLTRAMGSILRFQKEIPKNEEYECALFFFNQGLWRNLC